MSNWQTGATSSSFDAGAKVNEQFDARGQRDNTGGMGYETLIASDKQYDRKMNDGFGWDFNDGAYYGETTDSGDLFNGFKDKVSGYNIVGIDGNQVPQMRAAIETYVEEVQGYLEDAITATQAEIATAFRGGEAEKAVEGYLSKVKSYVHNVVSTLNAFSDKLADVGNAWVQAQSNIASNINTSTGAFSEGSTYQPNQVQYTGPSR